MFFNHKGTILYKDGLTICPEGTFLCENGKVIAYVSDDVFFFAERNATKAKLLADMFDIDFKTFMGALFYNCSINIGSGQFLDEVNGYIYQTREEMESLVPLRGLRYEVLDFIRDFPKFNMSAEAFVGNVPVWDADPESALKEKAPELYEKIRADVDEEDEGCEEDEDYEEVDFRDICWKTIKAITAEK